MAAFAELHGEERSPLGAGRSADTGDDDLRPCRDERLTTQRPAVSAGHLRPRCRRLQPVVNPTRSTAVLPRRQPRQCSGAEVIHRVATPAAWHTVDHELAHVLVSQPDPPRRTRDSASTTRSQRADTRDHRRHRHMQRLRTHHARDVIRCWDGAPIQQHLARVLDTHDPIDSPRGVQQQHRVRHGRSPISR